VVHALHSLKHCCLHRITTGPEAVWKVEATPNSSHALSQHASVVLLLLLQLTVHVSLPAYLSTTFSCLGPAKQQELAARVDEVKQVFRYSQLGLHI